MTTPKYITENFMLQEFVSKEFYEVHKHKSLWFIDERIVATCQSLRDNLQIPLTINNWYWDGERNESGLRVPGMLNYSLYSQHTFGRAVDIISKRMSAEDMRKHIFFNKDIYPHIKAVERNVDWLHIDCRNTNQADIMFFNPR